MYDILGSLSSLLFLLSLSGLWIQLRTIWKRSQKTYERGEVSQSLSLTHLTGSFFAFYASLLYGIFTSVFNHYLVWTRLVACLLVFGILLLVYLDRRDIPSKRGVVVTTAAMVLAVGLMAVGRHYMELGIPAAKIFLFCSTIYFLNGFLIQTRIIRSSGRVGAVSQRSHQFLAVKDFGNVLFSMAMGLKDGLPLFLSFSSTLACRLILLRTLRAVGKREGA